MWSGVECDEMTGHVIGLDLGSSFLYGSIDSNSTLFDLLHLQRLDLWDNHFNYSQIPTAINRLSMLTYLDLSFSSFIGQIPSELSQLSKLSNLDLSTNPLQLKKPNLESLISNFTRLERLCLNHVDISSTVPKSLANFSFLTCLQLRECKLKGEFPVDIFQLPDLQILSVRFNKDLSGRLPPVLNQNNSLKSLWLAGTGFSGEIPFEKLASLSALDASNCNFSGVIPSNLIRKLNQLIYLDLSENNFVGEIPSSLGNLTQLTMLSLSSNYFSGPIPLSLSKLINLETLYLYNNDLRDIVDFDMFVGLKNLTFLDLLHNYNLSVIVVNPGINETFPQFKELGLSNCNLRNFPVFLRHQKRMETLFLDDNHIGGPIPEWLFNISKETLSLLSLTENSLIGELSHRVCNFSSLNFLDISDNKLVGKLPHCLGNLSKSILVLKLRSNYFSGNIPNFTEGNQLKIIDLGYNLFKGKLSKSLSNCKMLVHLNVESNKLSDVFPYWLGILPELEILVLRANELHGVIGESIKIFYFPKLRIIDMSYNNFSGKLPLKYIQNWKAMTTTNIEDFGYMSSTFKNTTNDGSSWSFYSQATIAIKGINMFYERIQNIIVVINLSNNKFDGEISQVVGNLKRLYSLDLSCNRLSGDIPSSLGNLAELESLDLSRNELSGEIPSELAQLYFLQYFNVSYNHLSGPIPQQNQLAKFERSSYEGNLGLCGIPLPDLCENSKPLEPPLLSSEENSSSPLQFGWKVVAIGYGCGFLIGLFIGKVVMEKNPNWFVIMFNIRS
ncbi:receptor-like protein Cf-9 homolog [Humulus lupulus]|uniref:receptor-like protein Cf-9 homolog n=1 Tax=Humulus lupulus TaxID=3486 RepID=UPI002B40EE1D|nr:receptor-like protein Cf-9 homolog [Humulus lupulus]